MGYSKRNPNGQATMANSEPVVIASDQSAVPVSNTGLTNLNGAIAGTEVQVDVVASLPAGTNNIGDVDVLTLPSLPAGTNNIGDVDILSIAAGDNNIGNVDVVTLPSIPAGTNNIGDVDVLTMPGIVVEDAAETVGGNLMAVGTVRRDTAASSAGTTGDNATLNTDSLGRLWISGAAVEDAASTAGGILLMAGSVRRDTAASSAGTTGDNATINTDSVGALWTRDTATQVDDAAFTPATGRVMPVAYLADETATDSVDEGDAGAARMTLDRKQIVAHYAHTAGGATPYKLVSAATTNATSVKASAGTVYMITASNVNAAVRYLKLYNKASAPTVGTDVPVFTFAIPGNTAGAGTNIPVPTVGINFGTGIALALTTEATDAGTTAVAANEIVVNLAYA